MICLSWAEYRFSFQQYICFNDAGTSVPFFFIRNPIRAEI